ncbi:unnamed protein product [Mytilus edulis]|uniref:EGF-like domain-containing protein n=1 Tax=Mytilus edulis TaxID=6550 RepID=A0A8S3TUV5_MYTED|nr:unnamed protein product [Mytilus edulis]
MVFLGAADDATCSGSGAGDCSEANNICVAGTSKCACATTSFRKGGTECATRIVLKATCVVAETDPDQCVVGAECKDDGKGAKKCLCKTTHYESSANCVPRIVPGATCAAKQCVTHASCNTTSTKCKCDAGYTATPTAKPTICSGVMKVPTLSYMLAVPIFVSMMSLLR